MCPTHHHIHYPTNEAPKMSYGKGFFTERDEALLHPDATSMVLATSEPETVTGVGSANSDRYEYDYLADTEFTTFSNRSRQRWFWLKTCFVLVGMAAFAVGAWRLYLRFHQTTGTGKETGGGPRRVGVLPIMPSFCASFNPNQQPYYVPIKVNGTTFAVIPDTGSSNLVIASRDCESCSVSPRVPPPSGGVFPSPSSADTYKISYGTGSATSAVVSAELEVAPGLLVQNGELGVIVSQNTTFGFSLFSTRPQGGIPTSATPTVDTCYNTYAGIMGLAYQGQGAQPEPNATSGPSLTNGTKTQVVDQMVAQLGVPNAFAMEMCMRYPWRCSSQRRTDNSTWVPTGECRIQNVGNIFWGGYASKRLASDMKYAKLTDTIHINVQVKGMTVCGVNGCEDVVFPDPVNGTTENDCNCSTPTCAPGTISYCSFAVVDSGAGRFYMNTPGNGEALLTSLMGVGVVVFPNRSEVNSTTIRDFYFNKYPIRGAYVADGASMDVHLLADSSSQEKSNSRVIDGDAVVTVPVFLDGAVFRQNFTVGGVEQGLMQWGIQGNLDILKSFAAAKFPTLLGDTFLQGKTFFIDRSKRRVGFADNDRERCGTTADKGDIDVFGSDTVATPGAGCRRGTGSGGGCPQ